MKKSFVKAVALTATAVTLSGIVVPVVAAVEDGEQTSENVNTGESTPGGAENSEPKSGEPDTTEPGAGGEDNSDLGADPTEQDLINNFKSAVETQVAVLNGLQSSVVLSLIHI